MQYAALGVIFILAAGLNFMASNSLSKVRAQTAREIPKQLEAAEFLKEYETIKAESARLKEKADCISDTETKIDISSVLAELSFLVDGKVVFTSFDFSAEAFVEKSDAESAGGNLVRSSRAVAGKKDRQRYSGDVRYKVTIGGMAAGAAVVAELICRLEDSPYFFQVIPSYSRNIKITAGDTSTAQEYGVTEFEVVCYVANYDQPVSGK